MRQMENPPFPIGPLRAEGTVERAACIRVSARSMAVATCYNVLASVFLSPLIGPFFIRLTTA